MGIAQSRVSEV